jgi:hypothetical protein
MIGGAVVIAIGCFLPWLTIDGDSFNGFASGENDDTSDGYLFTVLGVALLAFGITTLLARRLLPIAILATVFGGFVVLGTIVDLSDASDIIDVAGAFGADASLGAGLPIILVGALASLAGGIVALATRRQ